MNWEQFIRDSGFAGQSRRFLQKKIASARKLHGETIFTKGHIWIRHYKLTVCRIQFRILEDMAVSNVLLFISNQLHRKITLKPKGSIRRLHENVGDKVWKQGDSGKEYKCYESATNSSAGWTAETLKDGWLHAGDKSYMDEDGYLFDNSSHWPEKSVNFSPTRKNVSAEELWENKLAWTRLLRK